MSDVYDIGKFAKEDVYYYVATEKEKSQGQKEDNVPLAVKLTDELEVKLGLDPQYTYYIAFAFPTGSEDLGNYSKFMEYLFG